MNRMHGWIKVLSTSCVGLLCALAFGQATSQIAGAIFTTFPNGTTVDGNIYPSKDQVYLNGGPQNVQGSLLVPDGIYYFQVTDPSGKNLLSLDPAVCRQVYVTNGRISGVVPAGGCEHLTQPLNPANNNVPVQLCNPVAALCATDFADTSNNGGEYKAWLIYSSLNNDGTPNTGNNCAGQVTVDAHDNTVLNFPDSCAKTDNFKIRNPNIAYIVACKFDTSSRDPNDPTAFPTTPPDVPYPGWEITAHGVDDPITDKKNQTVTETTDSLGCVSFAVTNLSTVTVTEGSRAGWEATNIAFFANQADSCVASGLTSVSCQKLTAGETVEVDFGNAMPSAEVLPLKVTKTAKPSNSLTWQIKKDVDQTEVDTSSDSATFKYTVSVKHDAGSGWQLQGTISIYNPNDTDVSDVDVTDAADGATGCSIIGGGTGLTVPATKTITVDYTCSFAGDIDNPPADGNNVATATWTDQNGDPASASNDPLPFDFPGKVSDDCVTVTDPLFTGGTPPATADTLGTVCYGQVLKDTWFALPQYSKTYSGNTAGTCTSHDNTATFTTDDTGTTDTASQTVKVCVGADLTVKKDATPAFTRTYNWNITKTVDKTRIEISGGTATFNYKVTANETGFIDSAWQVSGKITVTNPNDWESVTVNVGDALDTGSNGACTVTGGTALVVPAKSKGVDGSASATYSCSYSAQPSPSSGTNTATATVTAGITPTAAPTGTAPYAFGAPTSTVDKVVNVTDTFNGTKTTLGQLTATDTKPYTTATYAYSHTVNAPTGGSCHEYDNTAVVADNSTQTVLGQSSQAVNVCNTNSGALTMGFWQNNNGQGIIKGPTPNAACTNLTNYLRGFKPFQDLSSTATCAQVATYVYNFIHGAGSSCGGTTCNAMLKAQMLATALDVYFSTPSLGGNKIGAYNGLGNATPPLGSVKVDLTSICPKADGGGGTCPENTSAAFSTPPTCQTVNMLLSYAASQATAATSANPLASKWYLDVKATQVLAKDTFDSINNDAAPICP